MSRVVLAMSGGVDSSVAAYLLQQAGHEVIGLFMRHGEHSPQTACSVEAAPGQTAGKTQPAALPILKPGHKQGCCSASDAEDARRMADRLDISFYAVDFQQEFGRIMDYFVEEYLQARTPNPCVMCNNWLKFGKLWDYARGIGAEMIATGHYARIEEDEDGELGLFRGLDQDKDQSYVLAGIDRELFPRLRFPVGNYRKTEIRRIAAEIGMRVADKKDSQEICFVPDGNYANFVRRRQGELDTAGDFVSVEGEVLGQHAGIERFTIGQRKGLGIAFGEPRYVVRIDADSKQVVLGRKDDLACTSLTASNTNWLIDLPAAPGDPDCKIECDVKIRYLSVPVPATVQILPENRMSVEMAEPKHGVAPGQAVVCYRGDQVLGGGWIDN
ncbi:tRNA-specific 2-thiouridylase MnmA [Planctomycetales bacterium 10988]|nr:tRNA-specific 2-thiouridylase MnmA [Planctomycetales bacterium 10988]